MKGIAVKCIKEITVHANIHDQKHLSMINTCLISWAIIQVLVIRTPQFYSVKRIFRIDLIGPTCNRIPDDVISATYKYSNPPPAMLHCFPCLGNYHVSFRISESQNDRLICMLKHCIDFGISLQIVLGIAALRIGCRSLISTEIL